MSPLNSKAMGLNYTDGCVNFRDLGEYINLVLGEDTFPNGKIYRGGSIDAVKHLSEIGHAQTIFNLRNRADYQVFDIAYHDFPMSNKIEKYDTSQKEVKRWLNQVIGSFQSEDIEYPVLIHCLSGKDRTGIVIAAILLILGYKEDDIIEEYFFSEGEVKLELIQLAINGMRPIEEYFEQIDLAIVRKHLK